MKKDADGVAVCSDQEVHAIQHGLSWAGVLVLRGNDHESPRGHVFQEKCVIARERIGAIAPGENRMLEAAHPQASGVVKIKLVAGGVAALRANRHGDGPRTCAVVFQLDGLKYYGAGP